MNKRKSKSFSVKFFSNQLFFFFIGLIVLVLILHPLYKKISYRRALNNEIKELNEEIEKLEGKNKDLDSVIAYLESNEFVEEEARINLNLKNEGEDVVVINTKHTVNLQVQENERKRQGKNNNFINWWNYFLK